MARLVQESLKLTVDAMGDADADKALEVWRSDEAVDDIYNALFRELITYMMEDPRQHHALHASAVHRQEPRADRRSRHQHRREPCITQ